MSSYYIRIERDRNGYEVCLTDPKLVDKNDDTDSKWEDPTVEYNFKTSDQVVKFIESVIDIALPADETTKYTTAFDKAAKEVNDE